MIFNAKRKMQWRRQKCFIKESFVYGTGEAEDYNPFDYYGIQGEKGPHMQFVATDPKDSAQIEAFIEKFGILKSYEERVPVSDFIHELLAMRSIVQLYDEINQQKKDLDQIIKKYYMCVEYTNITSPTERFAFGEPAIPHDYKENMASIIDYCNGLISIVVSRNLRDVSPDINYSFKTRKLTGGWHAPNLLTVLYVMLYLDLVQGKLLRKCKNKKCPKYFEIAGNETRKIYCNNDCAKTQWQREKRREEKEEKING